MFKQFLQKEKKKARKRERENRKEKKFIRVIQETSLSREESSSRKNSPLRAPHSGQK